MLTCPFLFDAVFWVDKAQGDSVATSRLAPPGGGRAFEASLLSELLTRLRALVAGFRACSAMLVRASCQGLDRSVALVGTGLAELNASLHVGHPAARPGAIQACTQAIFAGYPA